MALSLVLWSCYSYSDYIYDYTNNVAIASNTWKQVDMLSSTGGIDINGIVYKYSVVKDPLADMKVTIQNKDTQGTGYIFREVDDWSGQPGSTINKVIALPNIPANRFGDGEIKIDGEGSVLNPSVIYTYRIDTDYRDLSALDNLPQVEMYNALDDDAVKNATKDSDREYYEEDQDEDVDREERVRTALEASDIAVAQAQDSIIQAMTLATNITAYYAKQLKSGSYNETVTLVDSRLPNSDKGLRNGLAQQILHDKMVDMQWRKK